MEYVTATSDMASAIYNVLHTTIKAVYAKYYPKEVVDFFCQHHSKEHILDGIASKIWAYYLRMVRLLERAALIIIILRDYMCCLLIRSKASDRILWIVWKWKFQKNLMLLF